MSEKVNPIILFGITAAVALYWVSRTKQGEAVISDTTDSIGQTVNTIVSAVRGIRNNNPGNIRKSSETWRGLAEDQTDPDFFRFTSMAYGVRAMVRILQNYSMKYGLDTPAGIIARWAPPTENDTKAYSVAVAQSLDVATTTRIDVYDSNTMFNLVRGIVAHENGRIAALLVSDSDVWQGIELA